MFDYLSQSGITKKIACPSEPVIERSAYRCPINNYFVSFLVKTECILKFSQKNIKCSELIHRNSSVSCFLGTAPIRM